MLKRPLPWLLHGHVEARHGCRVVIHGYIIAARKALSPAFTLARLNVWFEAPRLSYATVVVCFARGVSAASNEAATRESAIIYHVSATNMMPLVVGATARQRRRRWRANAPEPYAVQRGARYINNTHG